MPIYEYQCQECNKRFDKFVRSFSAEDQVACPTCGSQQVRKGFSTFASLSSSTGSAAISSAPNCTPTA